jgi:hypothetical protein
MVLGLLLCQLVLFVLAILALAQVGARDTCHEALAVFFPTIGLLAVASSDVQVLVLSFLHGSSFIFAAERIWVLLFRFLDHQVSDIFELLLVVTINASTLR